MATREKKSVASKKTPPVQHSKAPFKKGDVLVSKWGYEQTNVQFFKVLSATDKTVTIQEVGQKKEQGGGFGNYYATPTSKKVGEPFRRKIITDTTEPTVYDGYKHGLARKWKGKPEHGTDYY